MKTPLQYALSALVLLFIPNINFGQAPNLGSTSVFALFTATGAINNIGATVINGDIGTDAGAFNGFPPGIVNGGIHVADAVSAQAAIDVELAYAQLSGAPCGPVLAVGLGNNQMLTPNTYCTGAAATLNGDLILDGQCDPDAIFIFKIDGALATSINSNIVLTNAASLCNVYWQVNGAVALGDDSVFRGTILASGAISMLENAALLGRGLSREGAINLSTNVVDNDLQPTASLIVTDGTITFCQGGSVVLSGNCGGTWSNGETTPSITVNTSGDYFVTTTNDCGSAISNHILVTVNPLPVCTISGADFFCMGQSTQLCAPAGLSGYLWSTGATTNCITVNAVGNYSVTITGANGCSSVCSKNIILSTPPICTITGNDCVCPGQPTQLCATTTAASFLWSTGEVTSCIFVSAAGTYSVTVSNADGYSSVCSKTIIPVLPPVIICPADVTVECDESNLPPNTGTATATNNCDLVPSIVFNDLNLGSVCPNEFSIARTWTATKACGIGTYCIQTLMIIDTVSPLVHCPVNRTVQCVDQVPPVNVSLVVTSDNCGGMFTVTHTGDIISDQTCVNSFTLTRNYLATDACGNAAACAQTITGLDNMPPKITFADSLLLNGDTLWVQCFGQDPEWDLPFFDEGSVFAEDSRAGAVKVVFDQYQLGSGDCVNGIINLYRLSWVATDTCGNTDSVFLSLALIDTISPIIFGVPADITRSCNEIPTLTCSLNWTGWIRAA